MAPGATQRQRDRIGWLRQMVEPCFDPHAARARRGGSRCNLVGAQAHGARVKQDDGITAVDRALANLFHKHRDARRPGGKEVQAGIGDQASMGVARGPAAGSTGTEAISKPMGRVARVFFFRHFDKLPEEVSCAVGSEWASRLRMWARTDCFRPDPKER